jgi:endonuclease/exonuclease/phosphatase family metal-dependent hydrolase
MRPPLLRFPPLLVGLLLLSGCLEDGPTPFGPAGLEESAVRLPAPASVPTTVLTRNLYLGGDISPLLGPGDPLEAAAGIWEQILSTDYPTRAAALADEILAGGVDVVGLQEVTRYTAGLEDEEGFPQGPLLDFLAVLQAHLQARGATYHVAVEQPGTRVALPVPLGGTPVLIGYQDGLAILVRDGIEFREPRSGRYAASPPAHLTANLSFHRGWTSVEVRLGTGWYRFVNTHLEIQEFAPVQVAQTLELLSILEGESLPTVLLGDLNSAANPSAPADRKTATYPTLLEAGFVDLWTRSNDPDDGLTCCHDPPLDNPSAPFDQRLDLILARNLPMGSGFAGDARLHVVGDRPGDRVATNDGRFLWPSDHAGVVGRLRLPPGLLARD